MKKLTLTIAFCLLGYIGFSQTSTYVNPYTKKNGTYVEGYNRTTPNNTNIDNYSTQGNSTFHQSIQILLKNSQKLSHLESKNIYLINSYTY